MKENKSNGIFQTFGMEKFSDKESLIDVMYTLNKEAKICDKDYRLWCKLNKDANITVRTSVGESGTCQVKNIIDQGMLGAALASSLNIGCALKETICKLRQKYKVLTHRQPEMQERNAENSER